MDKALQVLLTRAEQENNVTVLQEAHEKLKRGRKNINAQTDPFNPDQYVICAEIALKLGAQEISDSCIKLYFQKKPPNNQFLCRAYLCQAQLHAPVSSSEQEKLEQCIGYLLKAINFAKTNTRYHFLVYNASVLYWFMVRPFLKPNHRHLLAKTLHIVVKSLDDTNDEDFEWRSHLMMSLIECHVDAGNKEDAVQVSTSAMQFAKLHLPHVCKDVLALQVMYKLVDTTKINSVTKGYTELSIFYRIFKLKGAKEQSTIQSSSELERILQAIIDDEDLEARSRASSGNKNNNKLIIPLTNTERNNLLLELSRLCLELGYPEIGFKSIDEMKDPPTAVSLEGKFVKCELMGATLKEDSYSKSNIEVRLQAIQLLDEHLMAAYRISNENLIQVGCVSLWNLCLPLLQINLRSKVRKYLLSIVQMLEEIDSMLLLLRCQIHIELSKCEENEDQLQSAILHLIKASKLDDTGFYKVRIEHTLQRLKLKALLYQVPTRVEDHARMIIEQAESSRDASTSEKMCVYLSKAGSLLSPDAFELAMDGERILKTLKGDQSITKLAEKVKRYNKGVSKISGHMKHLEGTDDRERVQLWADLVKTARKQNVWDVTRTAARFCLLYDTDNIQAQKPAEVLASPAKTVDSRVSTNTTSTPTSMGNGVGTEVGAVSKKQLEGMIKFSDDNDILCLFAEINFLYAEALVQLLQTESLQLLETPIPPTDTKLRPKKYAAQAKTENEDGWVSYCNWINGISNEAILKFQRAATIGCELDQSWIVCNASVYIWNYTDHILTKKNYPLLVEHFQPFFNAMRSFGSDTEINLLCDMAHALAQGYMQPHVPIPPPANPVDKNVSPRGRTSTNDRKSKQGNKSQQNLNKLKAASALSIDAIADVKQALEILEYVLNITATNQNVATTIRHPLIKAWVLCKALLNQTIPKNYQIEKDDSNSAISRALCASEVMFLKCKDILEVSPVPPLNEVMSLINNAKWNSNITLLEIWSQLAVVSENKKDYENSIICANTAIEVGRKSNAKKMSDRKKSFWLHIYTVEQEMLHYANMAKAQCLVMQVNGRAEIRKQALQCFIQACTHATNALNYELVMNSAQHYWNVIYPIVLVPIERQLLQQPILKLLDCIAAVSKDQVKESRDAKVVAGTAIKSSVKNTPNAPTGVESEDTTQANTSYDKDLKLRAALYGLLFQTYSDKGDLINGLEAMNNAIKVMPRTYHRLLIFKHRIITHAKLDKPFQFDMGKFRDEKESLLAEMWFRVAKYATHSEDKVSAYINSIEVLTQTENVYQKIDHLAEFAEWMFVNSYPPKKAIDQLEYAISLLINYNINNHGKYNQSEINFTDRFVSYTDDLSYLEKIVDIKQMDVLIRLYTMLASITSKTKESYKNYLLSAAYLVQRIWKVSLSNADLAVKDGTKPGHRSSSKIKEKKSSRDQLKTEKSTSRLSLPTTFESLALFKIPEKFLEHYEADSYGLYISKFAIEKPLLTMYYLQELFNALSTNGFHHLCINIIALMSIIANNIIENSSLCLLVNLMSCDLYEKLHMVNAYEQHQELIKKFMLSKEDQIRSREEINQWLDKQRQVEKEEQRQQNKISFVTSFQNTFLTSKQKVGNVVLREVWVKSAEYLINQSQFAIARKLLEEASLSAVAFTDCKTQVHINYCYALLSFYERDWGKVVASLHQSFSQPTQQMFFMKKISVLIDSLHYYSKQDTSFQNQISDAGLVSCKSIIINSIEVLNSLIDNSNNSFGECKYIISSLNGKLGRVLHNESLEKQYVGNVSKRKEILQESCEYLLKSYTQLNNLGYKYESFKVMIKYTDIQREIVQLSTNENHLILTNNNEESLDKSIESTNQNMLYYNNVTSESTNQNIKEKLMEIYELSKTNLLNVLEESADIMKLSNLEEQNNVFLPIQYDIVQAKISLINTMVEIVAIALEEKRVRRREDEKKEDIIKLIDEYVDMKEKLSDSEEVWKQMIETICEEACTLVVSIDHDSSKIPDLHATSLLHCGKLIGLLARYDNSDWFDSWNVDTNIGNLQPNVQGSEEIDTNDKYDTFIESYTSLQSQSTQCLLQALHIALTNGNIDLIKTCSYELIEVIGVRDPVNTLQLLALYQSSSVSISMQTLLQRVFIDAHVSGSASLMTGSTMMKGVYDKKMNAANTLNEQHINEQEWYRRSLISKNHFDIIKDIPFNITFVILQHSADKKYLYAGVLSEKHLTCANNQKKSTDKESSSPHLQPVCNRVSTDENLLCSLREMYKSFKLSLSTELMRQAHVLNQKEKQDEAFGRSDSPSTEEGVPKDDSRLSKDEHARLQLEFDTIIVAMEAYMIVICKQLEVALSSEEHEMVVLLCDEFLLELPLEALSIFQTSNIKSLSRDFSLQAFYHRYKQGENSDTVGRQSKLEQKNVSSKGKNDSKAGGGKADKNAKAGGGKTGGSKEFVVDKDSILLDISNLKYVIDPLNDGRVDGSILEKSFDEFLVAQKTKLSKWTGTKGSESISSLKELQELLHVSPALLYSGYERFLSIIPANLVAPLNLSECYFGLILDLVETVESYSRQSNLDAYKSPTDLHLESPVHTSMILSLCGMASITLNQWTTTGQENSKKMKTIFNSMLDQNINIGNAVRSMITLPKPVIEEIESKSQKSGGKKKSSGKSSRVENNKSPASTVRSPASTGKTEVPTCEKSYGDKASYDQFNLVVYGLPNFVTSF